MVWIDRIDRRTNAAIVGLDLYTVADRHQSGLVEVIIQEQIESWQSNPYFLSASVHRSLDGVRVFTYSQWQPNFDHRSLPSPTVFSEFFPPETLQLEVSACWSVSSGIEIVTGDRITHLSEFRMMSSNQLEMRRRMAAKLDPANNSRGLISETLHRSLDGTRIFNYGQWESKEAFEAILKRPGFNPDKPYWEDLARNEFHLYNVVHVEEKTA